MRMTSPSRARRVLAALIIIGLPVLLVVPFHPEASLYGDVLGASPRWMRPAVWGVVEWGGNVAAFALYVIAVSAFVRRLPVALAIGCATSAVLEAAQLVIPSRVASLGDLVLNCAGSLFGAGLVALARRAPRRRRITVG